MPEHDEHEVRQAELDDLTHLEEAVAYANHFAEKARVSEAEIARLSADRDRFGEALELIRDTDPVDAALDPDRAIRVAREALRVRA